jgi:N-methylhydantoinase A/oxoprolinase/acetone carboxylase beta subunit
MIGPADGRTYGIGLDIGGTFTDFALIETESGNLRVYKSLTTPRDPAAGALEGLGKLLARYGVAARDVAVVVHGTTLVANALIERTGASVGLITTRGFRDALEMRTEQRYDIYNLFLQYPEPLVPRHLRRGIGERTDRDGRILVDPHMDEVRAVVADFQAAGVEAVAVCFLHAFRNPCNERTVADLVRQQWPGVAISLSSEVAPQIREYERTSTTVANAYVQPLLQDYLQRMRSGLEALGFRGAFYPMLSSGGVASVSAATTAPIQLIESGPAAGATAAAFFGGLRDEQDLISFDVGGTTAKICVIHGGRPSIATSMEAARVSRFQPGSGVPLQIPTVELLEIGAGGGSIARLDVMDLLRVGPTSARADPGPACYGRGGTAPTVTDADLLLGYLNPEYFLGGGMRLDRSAAERAVGSLARDLGMGTVETAWAIHNLVNEHMAAAIRMHLTEKSIDPRRYSLLAFGGGGPVHAAGVARILHVRRVILPPGAGVASAIGLLVAPASVELARSYPIGLDRIEWAAIRDLYRGLEDEALMRLAEVGVPADEVVLERAVDGRFVGQLHEISIPLANGALSEDHDAAVDELARTFIDRYRQLFKHVPTGAGIELLSWRLTARGRQRPIRIEPAAWGKPEAGTALKDVRPVFFGAVAESGRARTAGFVETPVYDRYRLAPGWSVDGPAVLEERESTTVVGPHMHAELDPRFNLVIRL